MTDGAERTEHFDDSDVRAVGRAARDRAMVERSRRIGGVPGAVLAGAMIAIRDLVETPRDDTAVAVSETPDEPHDIDRDGVSLAAGDVGGDRDLSIAPLPPRSLLVGRRRPRRRERAGGESPRSDGARDVRG